MKKNIGQLVISLDLELFWGVADKMTFEQYGNRAELVHEVAPQMLDLFAEFGIQVTWAAVGFAMARDLDELQTYLPLLRPTYDNPVHSNYRMLTGPEVKSHPKAFFGEDIMRRILAYPGQELGSHSFSHYYCQEPGQTKEQFRCDLQAAKKISSKFNHTPVSYVFARNHFNHEYLHVLQEEGFKTYRGNPQNYCYQPDNIEAPLKRIMRLADRYIPAVSGLTHDIECSSSLINVPASMFVAPLPGEANVFSDLRLNRIKGLMTTAAQSGQVVHLWWHPHNLTKNTDENLNNLRQIFLHFHNLHKEYGMISSHMLGASLPHLYKVSA